MTMDKYKDIHADSWVLACLVLLLGFGLQLGFDDHLCATGKGSTVDFYDVRKAGQALGVYTECHTDAVTQVCYRPIRVFY